MKKSFRLDGLGCANCAAKMEKRISKLDGVSKVTVNFMTTKMVIEGEDEKMPMILEEAEKIIKKLEPQVVLGKG
ncbi:MAG: cation transporter [Desulfitobacterium sp.]|mgnify:CR=1 FL=1|nr:cation transporter [Desulfitobacterium sp.]